MTTIPFQRQGVYCIRSDKEKAVVPSQQWLFRMIIVYQLKYECDLSINMDPDSFRQVTKCNNSEKWFNAMIKELKLMYNNKVWDLVELLVSGSIRLNMIQKIISKDITQYLLEVLFKEITFTIRKPSLQF